MRKMKWSPGSIVQKAVKYKTHIRDCIDGVENSKLTKIDINLPKREIIIKGGNSELFTI